MYGARLKALRKAQKWTLEEVGEKLGLGGKSSYHGYETEAKKPPIDKLLKLTELYGVSSDYILGLTDDPEPKKEITNLAEFFKRDNLHFDGITVDQRILDAMYSLMQAFVESKGESK